MNKVIGILLILSAPLCLSGYAITKFTFSALQKERAAAVQTTDGLPSLQEKTLGTTMMQAINVGLGFGVLFGTFGGIPLGIYLLVKKDEHTLPPVPPKNT